MRKAVVAGIATLLLGAAAGFAADMKADSGSVLVSDVTVKPGDSKLVRAAKMAIAARLQLTVHSATVIDNNTLLTTGGHFSAQTSAAAPLPDSYYTPPSAGQSYPSGPTPEQRAKIQQNIQSLRTEQGRMSDEEDQGPYGDVSPDQINKRMTEIPNQINQAQHQLNPQPPPQPPPL